MGTETIENPFIDFLPLQTSFETGFLAQLSRDLTFAVFVHVIKESALPVLLDLLAAPFDSVRLDLTPPRSVLASKSPVKK